jgi:uncharacterized membrane protein
LDDGLMEEIFREVAGATALAIEAIVVLVVAIGAAEAVIGAVKLIGRDQLFWNERRELWVRFAGWILLALEFALAADIIRSAVAPSWDEIGKLAAIAAIRTALNFFLARDIETMQAKRVEMAAEEARKGGAGNGVA